MFLDLKSRWKIYENITTLNDHTTIEDVYIVISCILCYERKLTVYESDINPCEKVEHNYTNCVSNDYLLNCI